MAGTQLECACSGKNESTQWKILFLFASLKPYLLFPTLGDVGVGD